MSEVDALDGEKEDLRRANGGFRRRLPDPDLLMAIFDRALDGMLLVDETSICVEANPAACKIFGLPPDKMVGKAFAWPGLDSQTGRRKLGEQGAVRGEGPLAHADGRRAQVEYAVSVMLPGLYLVVLRDVTERRQATEALRASEARFAPLAQFGIIGIMVGDFAGNISEANDALLRMVGCSRDDLHAGRLRWLDLTPPEWRAASESATEELRLRGVAGPWEIEYVRKDGARITILIGVAKLDQSSCICFVTDMTEQRRAQAMNARLASIVESSDDAIMGSELDGTVASWNQAAERLYGYPAEEIIGRSAALFIPDDRKAELRVILDRVRSGLPMNHLETVRRRKDGTLFEVALTFSPVKDSRGRIVGVSVIGRDLTEQRRSEANLRRTEEQLRQAQKLEAVGTLAGGIAHDFNNLLSVILTYSTTLARDLAPGDPMRSELEEMGRAAEKASELTRQLLAFGRRQILRPVVIDLNRIVGGMQKILIRLLGEHIELTLLLTPGLERTLADPVQMEQVIMNLVVNARDAMPQGGRLTIETTNAVLDAVQATEQGAAAPGSYVMLVVTDNGEGMDTPTRSRIFEPFFTTKKDKGTGLGLATVFGIVKQSGGHIVVASEPGKGTTFRIALQASGAGKTTSTAAAAEPALRHRGSETILLVEDEEHVRRAVRNVLRREGYQVLEAGGSGDALLVSEQFGAPIHLLLTDVIMPRMTGPQLAKRLAAARPGIRVLYMSGYADPSLEGEGLGNLESSFLQKPLSPDALLDKVREVIDSARSPAPSPM